MMRFLSLPEGEISNPPITNADRKGNLLVPRSKRRVSQRALHHHGREPAAYVSHPIRSWIKYQLVRSNKLGKEPRKRTHIESVRT
jgi:hypothetical protein